MDETYKSKQAPQEHINTKKMRWEMLRGSHAPMDLPFAILVVLIASIGLIMMFSASYASASVYQDNPAHFLLKQGPFVLAGLVIMYIVSRFNYQLLRGLSVIAMVTAIVLLALVPVIGTVIKGAKRWIYIGPISVQPSEIAKIAVIMLFAAMMSKNFHRMKSFKYGVLPYGAMLVLTVGLLLLQPHLSAIVLICAVGAVMMFVGGTQLRYFALAAAVAVPASMFVVNTMEHAKKRIDVWLDPFVDPLGDGFQAIQSLYAIGSGGLFGLGLGESRQKYLYLPEQHNDFVFAIVCEELGMFGAFVILLLFALLVLRGFWIALHAADRFGMLLVVGVCSLLALQVFFNVAVVTGLAPVTGISMPFFSYGGSSLLIQMAEMGVVLGVSRQMKARS